MFVCVRIFVEFVFQSHPFFSIFSSSRITIEVVYAETFLACCVGSQWKFPLKLESSFNFFVVVQKQALENSDAARFDRVDKRSQITWRLAILTPAKFSHFFLITWKFALLTALGLCRAIFNSRKIEPIFQLHGILTFLTDLESIDLCWYVPNTKYSLPL